MTSPTPPNEGLSARLREPMRYLSRTATVGSKEEADFEAMGDIILVNEGDFHGGQRDRREAADALDAKDKLIGELEDRWADAKDEIGRAAGRELHAAAELSRAEQLLAEAEKALREWAENPDGWNVDQVREAHATLAKIREHLKP